MGSKEEKRLSFSKVFAASIEDAKAGRLAMAMPVARHPAHQIIERVAEGNTVMGQNGRPVYQDWGGADLPWVGRRRGRCRRVWSAR